VLNVRGVHDIHTAELLVPEPSLVEVEIAIRKLKRYKSPGTDQILAEFIKEEMKHYVLRYTNLFILYGIRRNCYSSERNLLYQFIKWVIRLTVIIIKESVLAAYKILSNILLSRLTPYVNEITGDHQCGFHYNRSTTNKFFYICQIPEKNGSIMGQCISYLWTSRKSMTQLREKFFTVFCLNLVYFLLVRLIQMCLNEAYSKVCVAKLRSHTFLFRMA
jgi:hypothetical protein